MNNTFNSTPEPQDGASSPDSEYVCSDKGGRFGPQLAKDFLSDPRVMVLTLEALGFLVRLKAFEDALMPIPCDDAQACKILSIKTKVFRACMDELRASKDSLIELRNKHWYVRPFGAPMKVGVSEARTRAAERRWQIENEAKEEAQIKLEAELKKKQSRKKGSKAENAISDLFDQDCAQGHADDVTGLIAPLQQLATLFNQHCPSLNRVILETGTWGANRKTMLSARWKSHSSFAWWEELFANVEKSDFLTGRANPNFKATFDWMLMPSNFTKITEGNYSKNRSAARNGLFNPGKDAFAVGSYGTHQVDPTAPWLES